MTYILGLNAYHGDSSACLVSDGNLISAVEEERFRRIKHWAGFPLESIKYCLEVASINLSEVDHIAINTSPNSNFYKKLLHTIFNRPNPKFLFQRYKNRNERINIRQDLLSNFPDELFLGEIHFIEHHLSHLSSAHHVSPFEESVCVSVDGFGDFSSGAWGVATNSQIKIHERFFFPHSLGIFYQALTQYLGFPHYGDEYKVMGLAPYGKPSFMKQLREVVYLNQDGSFMLNLDLFNHQKGDVSFEWSGGSPEIGVLFSKEMENVIGIPPRKSGQALDNSHHDLAHSIQAMYEEAFFNLLNVAYEKTGIDKLTLAGGCAMNSVANGKIYRRSPFKNLYVQSAAGDAGGAIGCAYIVAEKFALLSSTTKFVMSHSYWGPSFEPPYIADVVIQNEVRFKEKGCTFECLPNSDLLCSRVAHEIANGKVVGWFQGRMEWGPRALGNRSILGDPRRTNMKDILNLKIKRRESFRPFAPSILREDVSEWFEEDDDVPFMMQVFQVREEKRDEIPAVTHVDGSGRLQTVDHSSNAIYYNLISEFKAITGVPIILNTSFNENEPVVCKPEEAVECFLRTQMDILVLGNWFIKRVN
jgi:carbamoyltransferase